jgi:2-oxoglutarate dehydrogenase E1 component
VNTLGKAPQDLFKEFEGKYDGPARPGPLGRREVPHGLSADVATPRGSVHLALGFNPSHLEIIDP